MSDDYFVHPNRFPKNAAGAFYSTGHQCRANSDSNAQQVWCGDCLACEAPEFEAPELLAPLKNENIDTYFVRQPATPDETTHAIAAAKVCCVAAIRYGGRDREIIGRLNNNPELCDYVVNENSELVLTVAADGELLPFAQAIVDRRSAEYLSNREGKPPLSDESLQ
jgi:hypothetical protein